MVKASHSLKPQLGYKRISPLAPEEVRDRAFWQSDPEDPVETIVDEIVRAEWRVNHLREEIETLGLEPKGRTRHNLAQQMAKRFLDPTRLVKAIQQLSDEEFRYYVTLQLQANLASYYTNPQGQKLWQGFSTSWSTMSARITKLGLALTMEDGQLFLPRGSRRWLTTLQLPFPATAPPTSSAQPADPREILMQIQQLLNLLQVERFKLRDHLVWEAPDYPYAEPVVCWPLMPEDAQKLKANANIETIIGLCPPEPSLDGASLKRWAEVLSVTEDRAEFLYHILVVAGLILRGSPLTVDPDRVRDWMALTPSRQLGVLFHSYLHITPWAAWWPLWRKGSVRVSRAYHGYWGLVSIDQAVFQSANHLRWTLIELLSFLPEGTWLAAEDVTRWIVDLFPTSDSHNYLMGLNLEDTQGGWPRFLEEALLLTIAGPLQILGLADVGPSSEIPTPLQSGQAFRLHGLRDLHWGRVEEVSLGAPTSLNAAGRLSRQVLRFMPSESVLEVESPVPPAFLTFLLKWSRPVGFSRNLVRYQLDVPQLHQAFEEGEDPASLENTWKSSIEVEPLPEITRWWAYWWERYGHVRLYPAQAMLQTRDALTMHELQVALPVLETAFQGMLTPNAALLRDEDVDRVLDDLMRQGYMPKETS